MGGQDSGVGWDIVLPMRRPEWRSWGSSPGLFGATRLSGAVRIQKFQLVGKASFCSLTVYELGNV